MEPEFILKDVAFALGATVSEISLRTHAAGKQAVIYFVQGDFGNLAAAKVFRPSLGQAISVRKEFSALQTLGQCWPPDESIVMRSPVALMAFDWGYVMGIADGAPLAESLAALTGTGVIRSVAALLLSTLDTYHEKEGGAYFDFHLDNVLITADAGMLSLLDPGSANEEFFRRASMGATTEPLAVDICYWVYWHSVAALRRRRLRDVALVQLTREMLRQASPRLDRKTTAKLMANYRHELARTSGTKGRFIGMASSYWSDHVLAPHA